MSGVRIPQHPNYKFDSGAVVQLVRIPACHAGGRGFESRPLRHIGLFMLQRIRDRISGWIAGVIIALVAGAFILFSVEFYFEQSSGGGDVAAKVNGVTITDQAVNNFYAALQNKVMAQSGGQPLSADMEQQLKAYALQTIVMQTGLSTSLQNEGFHIGMQQVKMMVETAPQFQNQGRFSEQKFMQTLYQSGTTPLEFFQRVQTQWIIRDATNGVAATAFALPNEVNHLYSLMHQQRAFGYFIILAQSFLTKIKVTDEDIDNNYKNHLSQYQTPTKVSVSYIELSPTAADVAKKSSQLADITYTNPDSLESASKTLNLPIQTSDMMTQAGEKTGLFSNPKILKAIFSDSVFQAGNNSDPIRLTNGSQVVLRIAKKIPATPIPLNAVRDQIKKQLSEKKASAQAGLLAYQLQKKLSHGVDPVMLAKANGLQWKTVALTTADAKLSLPAAAMLSAVFSTPVSAAAKNKIMGAQSVLVNQHDYAVIAITQVKNANPARSTTVINQKLSQKLSALWGQLLQHYFVGSVMVDTKIKIYTILT